MPEDLAASHTSWDRETILGLRDRYFAATQRAFVPYSDPLVIKRGEMQYPTFSK